jgi:3-deoxy-D-manno-octulosonic-acid transferase
MVATRFSASAERLATTMPADVTEYIPYDRRKDVTRALTALRPDLLVFSKLDVWPELATSAARNGTRVALVAGSVDPGSARLGWVARTLARRGYAALELAAAISPEDAERLVLLGVDRERIVITGDPRVDAVLETVADAERELHGAAEMADPNILVAGSTWPDDDTVLIEALAEVRRWFPEARMIIVPHEPTVSNVAALAQRAQDRGLTVATWTGSPLADIAVTIVDRMGVLTSLYARGAVAYVGGGFGERGIHSVLEPAGWHRPVVIGPNDRGVRDANLLGLAGGLVRLPREAPATALATQWGAWIEHPSAREIAGRRAGKALAGDRGAARRSAELLASLRYP